MFLYLLKNILHGQKGKTYRRLQFTRTEYWSDYTPPEAIVEETLCGSEIDSGTGTYKGRDDISWSCTNEK